MPKKLTYVQVSLDVQKVETTYETFSMARRNPPAVEVNRHGRARTNVEGAEEWRQFFEDWKVDTDQPWITTGANKAQGLIFMYPAHKTEAGAIAVTWDPNARIYTTHFGAIMKECPAVRPVTTVEAQWKPGTDKDGKACLIINIKAAKAKRAGAANAETLAARAEEAAAKKAAKTASRQRVAAAKKGALQTAAGTQKAEE